MVSIRRKQTSKAKNSPITGMGKPGPEEEKRIGRQHGGLGCAEKWKAEMGTDLIEKQPTKAATVVGQHSVPLWLDGWLAHEVVPVPVEAVRLEIERAKAALVPADLRAVAVELDRTIAVHGQPPESWDDIAETYLEAFEDVPLDLVLKACKHVRLRCKFWPKPADFLAAISEELEQRRHVLRRLQVAEQRAKPAQRADDPPRATPEQIAAVKKVVEEGLRLMPGSSERPDDDGEREAETATDRQRLADEIYSRRRVPMPGERKRA